MDLADRLSIIEDRLFAELNFNTYERAVYYQVLRRTVVEGRDSVIVPLAELGAGAGVSVNTAREVIRLMASKGAIESEPVKQGYRLRLAPLEDILSVKTDGEEPAIDLDSLDFFAGRTYVGELLRREGNRCFYCLKVISQADCQLDHVVSQSIRLDNSYRNIVAACFQCNTEKGAAKADDFLRQLFRSGRLSADELADRIEQCNALVEGHLAPELPFR